MSKSNKPLSVIRIFEQIQSNIAEINTPPLSRDSIKINRDELKKLGDDEIETGLPFARISIDFPESNNEFTFCMDFLNTGVVLAVLDLEPLWRDYSELGDTNQQVSNLITDILVCLSSGQLAMLVTSTEDDDRLQALELLYRKPGRQKYDAICTATAFQPKRKLKGREYKTNIFVNNADIKRVSLDIASAQLLLMPDFNFELMSKIGRTNIAGLHEPLTLEIFNKNVDAYTQKAGERAEKEIGEKFGVDGMSFSEQMAHFARWRHIELMFWSLLLVLSPYIIQWNASDIHLGVPISAVLSALLFVFRKKYPYPQILFVLAPIAYIVFICSAATYYNNFVVHWISWVIGIGAFISLAENIYFDIRAVRLKMQK